MRVACWIPTDDTTRLRFPRRHRIHAGDLTSSGKYDKVKAASIWLGSLSHPHKTAIAANHDLVSESNPCHAIAFLRSGGATCLEDTGIKIEGRSIFRSPWQPE